MPKKGRNNIYLKYQHVRSLLLHGHPSRGCRDPHRRYIDHRRDVSEFCEIAPSSLYTLILCLTGDFNRLI